MNFEEEKHIFFWGFLYVDIKFMMIEDIEMKENENKNFKLK